MQRGTKEERLGKHEEARKGEEQMSEPRVQVHPERSVLAQTVKQD